MGKRIIATMGEKPCICCGECSRYEICQEASQEEIRANPLRAAVCLHYEDSGKCKCSASNCDRHITICVDIQNK